jgi:hypothetical protein
MFTLSPASLTPLLAELAYTLPNLLAYTEFLSLERHLHRPRRGILTLACVLLRHLCTILENLQRCSLPLKEAIG